MTQLALLDIDWKAILMGESKWDFLLEVALRSFFMYIIILVSLRVLGRRSINQLSVFELGVIIGLGSAAGDPTLYAEVGILPGLVVFITIVFLYRIMAWLINSSEKIEKILEGEPIYLIRKGEMDFDNFKSQPIAMDEFYSLLRQQNIVHLGQVEFAILETNGTVSTVFYDDEKVKPGLPILPHLYEKTSCEVPAKGIYACASCGHTHHFHSPTVEATFCSVCNHKKWLEASDKKRVS
ncbi:MAG: YetF domain-containing protein [Ferruginibacter sp.]